MGELDREGRVLKQGKRFGAWKSYHMSLKDGELSYSPESKTKTKKLFTLDDTSVVQSGIVLDGKVKTELKTKEHFPFTVTVQQKSVTLATLTESERDEWLRTLRTNLILLDIAGSILEDVAVGTLWELVSQKEGPLLRRQTLSPSFSRARAGTPTASQIFQMGATPPASPADDKVDILRLPRLSQLPIMNSPSTSPSKDDRSLRRSTSAYLDTSEARDRALTLRDTRKKALGQWRRMSDNVTPKRRNSTAPVEEKVNNPLFHHKKKG